MSLDSWKDPEQDGLTNTQNMKRGKKCGNKLKRKCCGKKKVEMGDCQSSHTKQKSATRAER
jgi:hypothetical protein